MKIIGDPGSCHMGRLDLAKELIRVGAACGLNAVKFQLLTGTQTRGTGNIGLDWDYLPELMALGDNLGVEVFASVFDLDGILWLQRCHARSIKFAYSMPALVQPDLEQNFDLVYVSLDVMRPLKHSGRNFISLYCIPEYPVRYVVDFEGIFPRFDGFSSHCLGIEQDVRAAEAGARYLEKHFTLDRADIDCPDHHFALRPKKLEELCKRIK